MRTLLLCLALSGCYYPSEGYFGGSNVGRSALQTWGSSGRQSFGDIYRGMPAQPWSQPQLQKQTTCFTTYYGLICN